MIKEILAILMILSIAGFASASYVNVETPVYEDSDIHVTWSYTYPTTNYVWIILHKANDNKIKNAWSIQEQNDGDHTILNDLISEYIDPSYPYKIGIDHKRRLPNNVEYRFGITLGNEPPLPPEPPVDHSIVESAIEPIPIIKGRTFIGYTFGTSDCNRISILMGQPPNAHANYTMKIISRNYKYNVTEMIHYCERCGANMTPITDEFYIWNP